MLMNLSPKAPKGRMVRMLMLCRIDIFKSTRQLQRKEERRQEAERRNRDALLLKQAIDAEDEPASSSLPQTQTQTAGSWYFNLHENPPQKSPGGIGANLSEPWSIGGQNIVPSSEAGHLDLPSIINRGRNTTGTEPVGQRGVQGLRENAVAASQDLNKTLPAKPSQVVSDNSLRSRYANEGPTPPNNTIPQRRTVGSKSASPSKKLQENDSTIRKIADDEPSPTLVPLHTIHLHATIPTDMDIEERVSPVSSEDLNEPIDEPIIHPRVWQSGQSSGSDDNKGRARINRNMALQEEKEDSSTDEEKQNEKMEQFREQSRRRKSRHRSLIDDHDELAGQSQEPRKEAERKEKGNGGSADRLDAVIATMLREREKHDERMERLREEHRIKKRELVDKHEQQLNSVEATKRKLETQLAKEQSAHTATKEALEEKMDNMRAEYNDEATERHREFLDQKSQLQKKFRNEKRVLEDENRIASEKLRNELDCVKAELSLERESKAGEIAELNSKHKDAIQQVNDRLQWQLSTAKEDLERIQDEKVRDIQSIRKERDNAVHQAEKKYQSLLEKAELDFDRETKAKDKEIKDLKSQQGTAIHKAGESLRQQLVARDEEIETMKIEYQASLSGMRDDYELNMAKALQGLQETNEVLQRALVKRSRFKAISDGEVASRFQQGIVIEVDELARVAWDIRWESSWPFSQQELQYATDKKQGKQAKRFLVQNDMWAILYEKIFCTPFRVFGNEGRAMEEEWLAIFGQGAPCPPASLQSEQWRYEKITTCVEAINQPVMDSEPNYSIKQGYESTLEEVSEELIQELKNISSVSNNHKQRVYRMVEKAAKLWLDVGQQRCRMFLVMSESGEMVKPVRSRPSSLKRDGTVDLVILPELRRLGNVEGELLDKNELVKDCGGKFSVFRTR
ncbi:uncharacterized protein PAC_02689 [Phialocephala subalpina]|uniref:Uncharacterized protein n=1 Tax=Phialocephala subalpina TaxID=576137 RepID=A0A1L7WJ64_9HELO|nr:uncharacterized protein PAC_02689 [Phialocephala subalpina]